MLKKISWLIAGLISLKIVNEIGYILINVSGEGVVFWKVTKAGAQNPVMRAFATEA